MRSSIYLSCYKWFNEYTILSHFLAPLGCGPFSIWSLLPPTNSPHSSGWPTISIFQKLYNHLIGSFGLLMNILVRYLPISLSWDITLRSPNIDFFYIQPNSPHLLQCEWHVYMSLQNRPSIISIWRAIFHYIRQIMHIPFVSRLL